VLVRAVLECPRNARIDYYYTRKYSSLFFEEY
jgi:hypothetical protein